MQGGRNGGGVGPKLGQRRMREIGADPVHCVATLAEAVPLLTRLVRAGDLVLTLGAGSIGGLGDRLVAALRQAPPPPAEAESSETA